jgi:hypothetical protein
MPQPHGGGRRLLRATLSAAQIAQARSGRSLALRVRAAGNVSRSPTAVFILSRLPRRNDATHANLAVVVDDDDIGSAGVVRRRPDGGTTGRQPWLYERLGRPAPAYAHVPLTLGDDGERLAKRHSAGRCASASRSVRRPAVARWARRSSMRMGTAATPRDLLAVFEPGCVQARIPSWRRWPSWRSARPLRVAGIDTEFMGGPLPARESPRPGRDAATRRRRRGYVTVLDPLGRVSTPSLAAVLADRRSRSSSMPAARIALLRACGTPG